jgi:N-acetylglucosaminyldiphosphoundecaprenol N-acetyl-beta-D-mannosaminyltransferase
MSDAMVIPQQTAETPRARGERKELADLEAVLFDPSPPAISLCGMPIHVVTMHDCVQYIVRHLQQRRGGWVVTPNVDILRRWVRQREFRRLVADSTLNVADGMPLVWASRLQGEPLPERVNGTNLISQLMPELASRQYSVFLVGGAPGSAEGAAQVLQQKHPGLRIAGVLCPDFGFEQSPDVFQAVADAVVAARPDVVLVGLGCPKQDIVISRLRPLLPSTWWLGIGVSFSFISGDIRRAPPLAQRLGLEWLYRLCCEPRRLAHRYLVQGLPFAARLFVSAAARRLRASSKRGAHLSRAADSPLASPALKSSPGALPLTGSNSASSSPLNQSP